MSSSVTSSTQTRPLPQSGPPRHRPDPTVSWLDPRATPPETIRQVAAQVQRAAPGEQRAYVEEAMLMLDVSPEAFMTLLQTQVRREDEKVLEAQNAIQRSITQSREIGQRMDVLQKIHQRLSQESDQKMKMDEGTIDLNGESLSLGEAVVRYDLMDELNLTDRVDPTDPEWFHGIKLNADAVQSAIEVLTREQQTVTSANEMNMINMQQAMQQRGQHLQLVSKVLSMMGDTERAIIGNMR